MKQSNQDWFSNKGNKKKWKGKIKRLPPLHMYARTLTTIMTIEILIFRQIQMFEVASKDKSKELQEGIEKSSSSGSGEWDWKKLKRGQENCLQNNV